MANLIMEIGTWGIAHNAQNWILGTLALIGIGFMVWDFILFCKQKTNN